jgi:hypothetical protein
VGKFDGYLPAARRLLRCLYALSDTKASEVMLAEVGWRLDPVFMPDVCEAGSQLGLVEINGFSCSWLYQCDLAAVVAEASRLASKAWEWAKCTLGQ